MASNVQELALPTANSACLEMGFWMGTRHQELGFADTKMNILSIKITRRGVYLKSAPHHIFKLIPFSAPTVLVG